MLAAVLPALRHGRSSAGPCGRQLLQQPGSRNGIAASCSHHGAAALRASDGSLLSRATYFTALHYARQPTASLQQRLSAVAAGSGGGLHALCQQLIRHHHVLGGSGRTACDRLRSSGATRGQLSSAACSRGGARQHNASSAVFAALVRRLHQSAAARWQWRGFGTSSSSRRDAALLAATQQLLRQAYGAWPGQFASAALLLLPRLWAGGLVPQWRLLQALSWDACAGLYRQTLSWLPGCLPSTRLATVAILNGITLVGNRLPHLLALAAVECLRGGPGARADAGFRYYLDVPDMDPSATGPWYRAWPAQLRSTAVNVLRVAWLVLLFAPLLLSSPLALVWNVKREDWMDLLRRTLEAAGPAFIKWGQWAATRHDLFPPDFCAELERLHTQAPGHHFRHSCAAIEAAFGMPVHQLFSRIDDQPVASGSIGQIHRAVLSARGAQVTGFPEGTLVAVKVRHPGVDDAILRDFGVMMFVAGLAARLPALQSLRLEETLKQFSAPLREQVDLSREAHNLWRFNHNFRRTRHVDFPQPLYPLVSPSVLVETFEEGQHITHYIASEHNPHNPRLAELGSGTVLQMMLVDNLIHSDLHPGNILVRLEPPAGLLGLAYRAVQRLADSGDLSSVNRGRLIKLLAGWQEPKMVLLDVGMATELAGDDQRNMLGLFQSFAACDGRAVAQWVLRFSGDRQSCPDPPAFIADVDRVFIGLRDVVSWTDSNGPYSSGADVMAEVLEMIRQHQVSLPGHICAVVVTTLVLEGWSFKLDPQHSVLSQVQSMFEPVNSTFGQRLGGVVDAVMGRDEEPLAVA